MRTIKIEDISELVKKATKVCESSKVDVMRAMSIEFKEKIAFLKVRNFSQQLTLQVPSSGKNDFVCNIDFYDLQNAIAPAKKGEIRFEKDGNPVVEYSLYGGKFNIEINQIGDCYLPFEIEGETESFKVNGKFFRAFQFLDDVRSKGGKCPMLTGIHFDEYGIAATDAKQCMIFDAGKFPAFTMPYSKMFDEWKDTQTGELIVYCDENKTPKFAKIKTDKFEFDTKMMVGSYPDIKRVFLDYGNDVTTIRLNDNARKALQSFIRIDKSIYKKITVEDGVVTITSESASKSRITLPARAEGENVSAVLDVNFLSHILAHNQNRIQIKDGESPIQADGGNGKFIVMPIRKLQEGNK